VPYLQLAGETGDLLVVRWITAAAADSWVDLRTDGGAWRRVGDAAPRQRHHVSLPGLQPDTEYTYRVFSGGLRSANYRFRTPPPRRADGGSESFTFLVYGDNRSYPDRHRSVILSMLAGPRPLFVLNTGDLVATGQDSAGWHREFFTPGEPLFSTTPLLVVLGNHDQGGTGSETLPRWWRELFSFPGPERGPGYGHWYSVDIGGVHLIVLDSNRVDNPEQTAWLATDLASAGAAGADFILVSFHHPSYSAGYYAGFPRTREQWSALFERHRVDLVLNGHNHVYQRSYPVVDGEPLVPDSTGHQSAAPAVFRAGEGIIYCVTGGGGAPLYEAVAADFLAVSKQAYHHLRIEYSPGRLDCAAVDVAGAVIDRFAIVRDPR